MDLNSLFASLLSDNSITSVAGKADVSAEDAAGVLAAALPMMLNGANGQASGAKTSDSFQEAVTAHAKRDPSTVDLTEGSKIVSHLLGDDAEVAQRAIAKKSGLSSAKVGLILAAAAPLLMNMLGSNSSSNSASGTASLLTSLLGGSSNSSASSSMMTSALTGLLGNALGGNASSSNSILTSVLGSALGGNVKPQSASAGLLGSLLGTNSQKPQASAAGLLGSLLSGGTQQASSASAANLLGSLLSGTQQPQHHASQQQSSGLDLGSVAGLLNSLLK